MRRRGGTAASARRNAYISFLGEQWVKGISFKGNGKDGKAKQLMSILDRRRCHKVRVNCTRIELENRAGAKLRTG